MAEYIKKALLAREIRKLLRVRESAVDIFQAGFEYGVDKAWANINKIPAADVAQVVRCKDCIFKGFPDEYDVCRCERTGEKIQLSGFCSHAVREEQNND